jgi:tetratricopeptide (TPR) repeat protein
MLKRVLTLFVGLLILGQTNVIAQEVDLTEAKQLYLYEKLSDAAQKLEAFAAQDPKNIDEVYYLLGMISYDQEAFEQAKDYFQMGLKERGGSGLNKSGMGKMMLKEGKTAEAYEFLESALAKSKGKDIDVEYAAADAYLEGGPAEIAEAKRILYQLKDKDPNDPRPNIYLADYYKKQGVPELAIEEYEKAKQKDPNFVQAYASLAELYLDEGKKTGDAETLNKGVKNANDAIEKNADYPPSYRIRGELNLLAKRYEAARDDLKKYVSMTSNDLKARIRYASFLFLSKNYQEAIDELEAISQDTVTNVMRRLRGMSYNQIGNQQKAEAAMQDYFDNVKKEEYIIWEDYDVYGDIFRAKGDLEKADEYYAKAIQLNDERTSKFETLAEMYKNLARANDRDIAVAKRAVREAKKEAIPLVNSYNAALKAGDAEKALELKPSMDEALAKIEELEGKIPSEEPSIENYRLEAHYRQKVNEYAAGESLAGYYKLGLALYKSNQYEKADESFVNAIKMKGDYLPPHQYRMQCAYYMEQADTTSNEWLALKPAEKVIEIWGEQDAASLDQKVKDLLLVAYEVQVFYNFNPSGEDGNYHCEDAQAWIDKIYAIDSGYSRIKSVSDYCEQSGQNR